jgi:hypothetical protein
MQSKNNDRQTCANTGFARDPSTGCGSTKLKGVWVDLGVGSSVDALWGRGYSLGPASPLH